MLDQADYERYREVIRDGLEVYRFPNGYEVCLKTVPADTRPVVIVTCGLEPNPHPRAEGRSVDPYDIYRPPHAVMVAPGLDDWRRERQYAPADLKRLLDLVAKADAAAVEPAAVCLKTSSMFSFPRLDIPGPRAKLEIADFPWPVKIFIEEDASVSADYPARYRLTENLEGEAQSNLSVYVLIHPSVPEAIRSCIIFHELVEAELVIKYKASEDAAHRMARRLEKYYAKEHLSSEDYDRFVEYRATHEEPSLTLNQLLDLAVPPESAD